MRRLSKATRAVRCLALAALVLFQAGALAGPWLSVANRQLTSVRIGLSKPPLGAHLVERGVFETISPDGKDLLAVQGYGTGVTVVRIDPLHANVLVRSPVLPEATHIFVVKSNIWVEVDAAGSVLGRLLQLDSETLRPIRSVLLSGLSDVAATSTGLLWVATGSSGCVLKRLGPQGGAVLAGVSLPGTSCDLAIDASRGILISVDGQGKLFSIDARSGQILHRSRVVRAGYWSFVAANGFFWFDSGGMSLPSTLTIYKSATLKLVKRELPPAGTCADITEPFFGCAGDALSLAGGLVWAANWNSFGCGDPTTLVLGGMSRPLGAVFPVVAIGSETFGIDEAPYPSASTGIVRFVAPPGCRALMKRAKS